MVSENKSITQNALINLTGLILLNGINFFAIPLYTRLLGAAGYGAVAIYSSWVQFAAVFIGLQVNGSLGQAKIHFGNERYNGYLSSVLLVSFFSFAIALSLGIAFINPLSSFIMLDRVFVILIIVNAYGSFCVSFATTKFIFAKQPVKTLGVSLASVLTTLSLSVILIINANSESAKISGAVLGKAVPPIVFGAAFFTFFLLKGKRLVVKEYYLFCLPICLPLIVHALSHVILSQCDKIMLQRAVSAEAVGVYSFFVTFSHLINSIWGASNSTWVPFYYDDVKAGATDSILSKTKNYIFFFTILVLGFMLLSPEAMKLFSTAEFWSGVKLIPLMCGGMFMIFLYSFPVNFELYHKNTKMVAVGTLGAAILNVALNFPMIRIWGIYGAAAATFLAYLSLFIFHQIVARKIGGSGYHYTFSTFIKGILAFFAGAAFFYLTLELWVLRWTTAALLGIILMVKIYRQKSLF